MGKLVGRIELEEKLTKKFKGKTAMFHYPGFNPVYGMVDQIAIDTTGRDPYVVIQMNDSRYTCSPEEFKNCLKLLKNGNTH